MSRRLSKDYLSWLGKVDPADFRNTDAKACVELVAQRAESCPRSFNADEVMRSCNLVAPTMQAGDSGCTDHWQCSTRFCKNSVCANPLSQGIACDLGDVCGTGLFCVGGACDSLQPDGAACTHGTECISGACGGGACVASATYTCDGQ